MDDDQPEDLTDASVEKTYREALDLAVRARAYLVSRLGGGKAEHSADLAAQISYAAETMRMTSRLMHVVAWGLNRRAVRAGELSETDVQAPDRRLGGAEVCLGEGIGDPEMLPDAVREMVDISEDLYKRALRLEECLDLRREDASQENAALDDHPVHRMWESLRDPGEG